MEGSVALEHPPVDSAQMVPAAEGPAPGEMELIALPDLVTAPPMSALAVAVRRRKYEIEHGVKTFVTHDAIT